MADRQREASLANAARPRQRQKSVPTKEIRNRGSFPPPPDEWGCRDRQVVRPGIE
jgi:hypothetical protein